MSVLFFYRSLCRFLVFFVSFFVVLCVVFVVFEMWSKTVNFLKAFTLCLATQFFEKQGWLPAQIARGMLQNGYMRGLYILYFLYTFTFKYYINMK